MNVVFMGNFIYPHGMADTKRIQHFVDYLSGRDIPVKLLLLRQAEVLVAHEQQEGVYGKACYRTIGSTIRLDWSLPVTVPRYIAAGILSLYKWKKPNSRNILYCYGTITIENILFQLAARCLGYRIVFDIVEDNTYIQEPLHPLAKLKWCTAEYLERFLPRIGSAMVVISHNLEKLYAESCGSAIPVCLIPISARCPEENLPPAQTGTVRIVYAGSFAVKDGVITLIEAFEAFWRSHHRNCQLLLTGKGANLPGILARIAQHPAIRYVGYLEDAAYYGFLQDADILCITRTGSTYANAGFPFKLGEYLATGKPVIVSAISDVTRYLEHMQDALIVEPDSVTAIVDALHYCLAHPDEARAIGLNGRRKCRLHFDPERNGQKLHDLLRRLS